MSIFLQQGAPTETMPATITAALISLLVIVGTQLPGIIKTGRGWVESRTQERKTRMKTFEAQIEQQIEQNGKLFVEIQRRDGLLADLTKTNLEVQRLANEQRQQFTEERAQWKVEMAKMVEEARSKDTTIEAQARLIIALQQERDRLVTENTQLRDRLKKYETGDLDSSKVPTTDPALKPTPTPPPEAPANG